MLKIKDKNTGMPVINCELPKGFEYEAEVQLKNFLYNQKLYLQMQAKKGNCLIAYQTGETYLYEKKPMANVFGMAQRHPLGTVSETGVIYGQPTALTDDIDQVAANILGKKVKAKDYLNPSEALAQKITNNCKELIQNTIEEVQVGMQIAGMPIGMIIRNYLNEGGIGIYEDEGKTLAIFLSRIGIESDIIQSPGISENIASEPFGQAPDIMGAVTSSVSWSIPGLSYMISDDKKDLGVFMNFIDSVKHTDELQNYAKQIAQQVQSANMQKAQIAQMENQATINMLWANQQQQFAAMDRLSASLSQDMDNFRNNLNATMAANDQRFGLGGSSSGESLDDRIQRMRHESMMGVETYNRSDGSTVEYSNMADRVFENNLDQTTHFGTHHYYDDYIPEGWHELKKK